MRIRTLALELRAVPPRGSGVFARRAFAVGEAVLVFTGPLAGPEGVDDHGRWLQVDDTLFLGSSGWLDDFVNHSCAPNCGVYQEPGEVLLRAVWPIRRGEEVVFDYSSWMAGGFWSMDCGCGTPLCRGRVQDFVDLPPEVQRRHLASGAVPAFVRRSLACLGPSGLSHPAGTLGAFPAAGTTHHGCAPAQ